MITARLYFEEVDPELKRELERHRFRTQVCEIMESYSELKLSEYKQSLKEKMPEKCISCKSSEDIRTTPITHDCMECGKTWTTNNTPTNEHTG